MKQSRSPEQAPRSRDLSGLFLFAILAGIVIIVLALTSAMAQSSVEVRQLRASVQDTPVAARLVDRRVRHAFTMIGARLILRPMEPNPPGAD